MSLTNTISEPKTKITQAFGSIDEDSPEEVYKNMESRLLLVLGEEINHL